MAAIVNVLDKANGGREMGRGEMENQLEEGGMEKSEGRRKWEEGEGREGKCWSPMLSPPTAFSQAQLVTGLAPGYSPVYTAPTLLWWLGNAIYRLEIFAVESFI